VDELTDIVKNSKRTGQKNSKTTANTSALGLRAKEIATLAKKYGVMVQPWLDESLLSSPQPSDMSGMDLSRYQNDSTKHDGLMAELYEFLPNYLHALMPHSQFVTLVSPLESSKIIGF